MDKTVSNYLSQADNAKEKGDYQLAEQFYRQALMLEPENVDILHRLAVLMLLAEQFSVAIPLLTKAINLQPNNAYLYYNLGLAYQGYQDIDAAIHYYKTAINKKSDFALAYNNIGVAYQHAGEFKQANKYLKTAFSLNPDCIEAYFNYTQSHKFTKNDLDVLSNIQKKLTDKHISVREKVSLYFSLGKIYDDLHQYEQAFIHYQAGNDLKYQGFNSSQFEDYILRIIRVYTESICKKLECNDLESSKRFVFIVGMPRSGSTLTEQIIASHPVVQSGGEIGFIGDIVDELPELLGTDTSYPDCLLTADKATMTDISMKVSAYLNNLSYNYQIITDKSPVNFLHIGLIMMLFPNSLVIHTQRDPVDTCLSCFFQNFEKQHQYSYNLKSLGHFYKQYSRLMQHWKAIFPTRIFDMQYEQLIYNREENIKALINFIRLDWDDVCLMHRQNNKIVTTASKWQSRQPIYQTSIGRSKFYQPYIGELLTTLSE